METNNNKLNLYLIIITIETVLKICLKNIGETTAHKIEETVTNSRQSLKNKYDSWEETIIHQIGYNDCNEK